MNVNALRIVVFGHIAYRSAVVEELVSRMQFSLIEIPSRGQCLQADIRPELWRPAMATFMAVHPLGLCFTGGVSGDVDWLRSQGAIAWSVSDQAVVHVEPAQGVASLFNPSVRGIRAQVDNALTLTRNLVSSVPRIDGRRAAC